MSSPTLPGTKPTRPSFPPPIPTWDLPDPGGATPQEHAHRTQKAVAADYTRWRAAHSRDIDPNVLKANAGAYSVSNPATQLPGVLDAVRQDSEDANRHVNDLVKGNRVGDDIASQLAAQRFWARAQRSLDATKDGAKAVAAARDLVNTTEDNQIPVLSEELASYLASRSLPTGWLTEALAQRIPGLAEAASDAILKARQYAVLQANHQKLQKAFDADVDAPPLLDPADQTSQPYSDYIG